MKIYIGKREQKTVVFVLGNLMSKVREVGITIDCSGNREETHLPAVKVFLVESGDIVMEGLKSQIR